MKKTAVLLAGLLLVTGTVFAESKFELGGAIDWKTRVVTSESDAIFKDDSNGDTDAELYMTYMPDEATSIKLGFNTDDDDVNDADGDSDADETMDIQITRTQGDIEVGFDLELTDTTDTNGDGNRAGLVLREDRDSDSTYIKWNIDEATSLAVYPFNMGMDSGASEFDEGDGYLEIPGIVYKTGSFYVGAGIDAVDKGTSGEGENIFALKAGYKTSTDTLTMDLEYSGAFYDEDEITAANYGPTTSRDLGEIAHSFMGIFKMPLSDMLTFNAELGYTSLGRKQKLTDANGKNPDDTDGGFGMWGKLTYKVSDVMSPYVSAKYATDGFYAWGDMRDLNTGDTVEGKNVKSGGVFTADLGFEYTLTENLVFNPELSFSVAGEDIYTDDKGARKEDSKYEVTVELTYSL